MKLSLTGRIPGLLLLAAAWSTPALACHPIEDGCLGCTDDQLAVCMDTLVLEICNAGGGLNQCDKRRIYDDAERHVLTSTGRHMSRVRAMIRGAVKYQTR